MPKCLTGPSQGLSATLVYDRLAAACLADATLRPVFGAEMKKALRRWLRESDRRPEPILRGSGRVIGLTATNAQKIAAYTGQTFRSAGFRVAGVAITARANRALRIADGI